MVEIEKQNIDAKLKLGIIGFGRFGQFISKYLSLHHEIHITSRTNYQNLANKLGFTYYPTMEELLNNKMDAIIVAVSINSFESVITKIVSTGKITNELFIDVLSVKNLPKKVFCDKLPPSCDILLTHPMFGPDSCPELSWENKKFVYYPVRIKNQIRYQKWMKPLEKCHLIEMSSDIHDFQTAHSQVITYFVGKVLNEIDIKSTQIDTESFNKLINIIQIVNNDSEDLFTGLVKYNPYAKQVIKEFLEKGNMILKNLNKG